MDIEEILEQLEYNTGKFPREALEAAIAGRDEIIPDLLLILEQAERDIPGLIGREDYLAHIYAMYLLAQFREQRAYPLLVRFFSFPGEASVDATGDVVTEDLGRILASVCGGDTTLIEGLIENEAASGWVRGAGLSSLLTLVSVGEKSREDVLNYFATLYRGRLVREPGQVWDSLTAYSADLCPEGLYDDIEQGYEDDLVDPGYIGWGEIGEALELGEQRLLARLRRHPRRQLINDTIAETQGWACFEENRSRYRRLDDHDAIVFERKETFRRSEPKVGRNDPCPCGSGKKYKKCCLVP